MEQLKDNLSYEAIFYADGGANPNPGYAGYGVHGYFFQSRKVKGLEEPKKPTIVVNHFLVNVNSKANKQDYVVVTEKGYKEYETAKHEKLKPTWVTPVAYYDQCFSFFDPATNNIGELTGLLDILETLVKVQRSGKKIVEALIILDSQYVLNTIEKYGDAYRENGWVTSAGSPAKNKEIIEAILKARDEVRENTKLIYQWQKGHIGDVGNSMADWLATISIRRSRDANNPNQGRWSNAKNYWDQDVERHPFLTFKRGFMNRVNLFNKEGHYYQIEPASEELMIGKRDHEAYSIVRMKNPCPFMETLKEAQGKFGQDENRVMLVRNERLYSKFVQKFIREHGSYCLHPSSNEKAVNFMDLTPVALEHNPPALFYRVLEAFGALEARLDEFIKITGESDIDPTEERQYADLIVHDATHEFYTVEDKQQGKEVNQKFTLKPEFVVGYKNHIFHVDETRDDKEHKLKISMALGMDLPSRNALKQLEDHKPKVYVITWRPAPTVIQYAFIIDCLSGTGIWSNYYCDRIFLK